MGTELPWEQRFARGWTVLVLAWMLCSAGACGGGSHGTGPPAVPRVAPGTWAVIGSSTAAGVGAPSGKGWAAQLGAAQQLIGVVTNNYARPGLLTSQALPTDTLPPGRAPPDPTANIDRALASSPKLVILAFPTNDAMAGVPAAETVGHWQLIRKRAAQAGAATVVLSTQPRDDLDATQRATLDETDRRAADAFGTCFVAVRAALSDAQGRIAPMYSAGDGVHLNAEGHRIVSERVIAALGSQRCVRLTD
jgi:lysophospholipase L1-like esterase